MNSRVLALTLGDDHTASSRVRTGQVLTHLASNGAYTARVTASSKLWPTQLLLRLIFRRFDTIIVQKVIPPTLVTRMIRRLSPYLIFEIDDAIYFGYPGDSIRASRTAMIRTKAMAHAADRIVTSNRVIKQDLSYVGLEKIFVFPGPAPSNSIIRASIRDTKRILWLGSPSTFANCTASVYPALDALRDLEMRCVGAPSDALRHLKNDVVVRETVWSLEAQRAELSLAHAGVAPLLDGEWNRRKAAYKVLEYLAAAVIPITCAYPAVVELLGAQLDTLCVVADGTTPSAWASAIERAQRTEVDANWYKARDEVFDRLSVSKFSTMFASPPEVWRIK